MRTLHRILSAWAKIAFAAKRSTTVPAVQYCCICWNRMPPMILRLHSWCRKKWDCVAQRLPDFALVLEATTAADIAGAEEDAKVCCLGGGPVVSFMDRSTIYDKELYRMAFSLAEKNGISCQTKSRIAGGNDSGAIHVSRGGVRTCALSVPCRYLHSPACVINEADYLATSKLAEAVLSAFAEL